MIVNFSLVAGDLLAFWLTGLYNRQSQDCLCLTGVYFGMVQGVVKDRFLCNESEYSRGG